MHDSRLTPHTLQRLCVALALTTAVTAVVGIGSQAWMRMVLSRGDRVAPRLLEDVLRAGQAKVAAERMTDAGRGYLDDGGGELLARARAEETKLDLALAGLRASAPISEEGGGLGRLPAALSRYREQFESIVVARSAGNDPETARAVMRARLHARAGRGRGRARRPDGPPGSAVDGAAGPTQRRRRPRLSHDGGGRDPRGHGRGALRLGGRGTRADARATPRALNVSLATRRRTRRAW